MDKVEGPKPSSQLNIAEDGDKFGPAQVASGPLPTPDVDEKAAVDADKAVAERDPNHLVPKMNLLDRPEPADRPVVPHEPVKLKPHSRKAAVVVLGLAALALGAGGAAAYDSVTPGPIIARATPMPTAAATSTPTATPSSTPSATPKPTTAPSPTPTQAPAEVTAPTVTPTKDNPQEVTVTSKSGIWLRSSPSSINRSNIIGWIPSGATVSVDEVGDFWWHGTYKGRPGYFAVKYTK